MDIFFPHISLDSLHHYIRTMTRSMAVRSHRDMLEWLQGDIQSYLPHQIMIAAWGDFETGTVQHDILSRLVGVRSTNSNHITITPMLLKLFKRWVEFGHRPYAIHGDESSFLIPDSGRECKISEALRNMRCVMVHGIYDERGCHDCVYAIFRNIEPFSPQEHDTMALMLPYVDTALRQVEHLPHQVRGVPVANIVSESTDSSVAPGNDLSDREVQVLYWVTQGKTNYEIGSILEISEFTVKNHMQRIFKKLDVFSRAQAVGKYKTMVRNV